MKVFLLSLSIITLSAQLKGCDHNTQPTPTPTAGRVTINSRVAGFSFSQAKVIDFPPPKNLLPDLLVLVQINQGGTIRGVYFSTIDLRPAFYLIRWPGTADSARTFFSSLTEIPDITFEDLALPVKANQIWAIKTRENKFAKILILHTVAYEDRSNPASPTPYGEATFDWVFQPNGSRQF